ncbi:MAG: type IV pilus modification protein PilV [Gammaproteobacteria bacterium]|nr:type IV pilus modification protein PilV [Gammaproteobacteria bacterium]
MRLTETRLNELASSRRHRRANGFTLVEVLVALVVMTVGMLGVAVLYVEGLRMNRTSILRTLAVGLTSDMADRIRANSEVPASYAGAGPGNNNNCVNGIATCTAAQQAEDDWFWWWNDVTTHLPAGVEANINVVGVGNLNRYEISLSWAEPGQAQLVSYTLPIQL